MGLDQFAYAVMPNKKNNDFGYVENEDENIESVILIAQWRKHADLQGWMEYLWAEKMKLNGEEFDEDDWSAFNCQPVRLTFQDIANLERAVREKDLPHTTGFFFGESCEEDMKDDIAFIEEARNAIASDMEIYYSSWW